jgi:hypothetical protein
MSIGVPRCRGASELQDHEQSPVIVKSLCCESKKSEKDETNSTKEVVKKRDIELIDLLVL